jgi:outer membrane immunogenic protein
MSGIKIGLLASAGLLALTSFTSLAAAADMAPVYKSPPPRVAAFSWTGFYIGAHVGGAWGTAESAANSVSSNCTTSDPFCSALSSGITGFSVPISQTQVNGFLGGGTVGYNVQLNPSIVLGIEGDFSGADIKGTSPCLLVVSCSAKHQWVATAAGRVGFTLDRLMFYLKGGAAWADTKYTASINLNFPPAFSIVGETSVKNTRVGALFGTGIEYAFLGNWSAKLEYDYIDFGKHNYNFDIFGDGSFVIGSSIHERLHMVKGGLNYRFNTSGI